MNILMDVFFMLGSLFFIIVFGKNPKKYKFGNFLFLANCMAFGFWSADLIKDLLKLWN